MVEAFLTHDGLAELENIPVLFPTDEILEFMSVLGYGADDAFSIEIPGGFSRPSRIRFLLDLGEVAEATLYNTTFSPESNPQKETGGMTGLFQWHDDTKRSSGQPIYGKMPVLIKPIKPLFAREDNEGLSLDPGMSGIVMVEAYDYRYAMCRHGQKRSRYPFPAANEMRYQHFDLTSQLYSADGRKRRDYGINSGAVYPFDATEFLLWFKAEMEARYPVVIALDGFDSSPELNDRIANLSLFPECSMAMAADIILSMTGHVALWDNTVLAKPGHAVYRIKKINANPNSVVESQCNNSKTMIAGGFEAMVEGDPDPIMQQVNLGLLGTERHRMGEETLVFAPYRTVEGKTLYNGFANPGGENDGWKGYVNWEMTRERPLQLEDIDPENPDSLFESILREPRAAIASVDASLPWDRTWENAPPLQIYADGSGEVPAPGTWNIDVYDAIVKDLLAYRSLVYYNDTAFCGWPLPNDGIALDPYRATMLKYTIARWKGKIMPVTRTTAKWDDWILGPNGDLTNDPRDVVMSRGMVHARRVGIGLLDVEVPPPNCRIFPAKIVSSTRVGATGNDYWRWKYQWVEVEPEPIAVAPLPYDNLLGGYERKSDTVTGSLSGSPGTYDNYARNLSENGNAYTSAGSSGNIINPGILQSDYQDSTIECDPVREGTIVTMVEQTIFKPRVVNNTALSHHPQFWFTSPNPFRVVCA